MSTIPKQEAAIDNHLATNRYLRHLNWVILVICAEIVYKILLEYTQFAKIEPDSGLAPHVAVVLSFAYLLLSLAALLVVGRAHNMGNKIWRVLCLQALLVSVRVAYFWYFPERPQAFYGLFAYLAIGSSFIIPLIYLVTLRPKNMPSAVQILWILFFWGGAGAILTGLQQIAQAEMFRYFWSWDTMHYVGEVISSVFWIVYVVFLCELLQWSNQDTKRDWSAFNVNNSYSNSEASILYYGLTIAMLGLVAGVLHIFIQLMSWLYDIHGSSTVFVDQFLAQLVWQLIGGIAIFFWVLRLFRHFLYEFLVSRGNVPIWKYWLLQMPIIGLILWPIMMLVLPKSVSFQRRVDTFEATSDNHSLSNFKLLLVILASVVGIATGLATRDAGAFFAMLLILGAYIWFVYQAIGYYVYICCGLSVLALQLFLGYDIRSQLPFIHIISGIIGAYMMYPVFHTHVFTREYIPSELEPDTPNEDTVQ